jgi:hypothetical protein
MTPELSSISDTLKSGRTVPPVTVREFLAWFGVQRRGYQIVEDIRNQLSEAGVTTEPDFESHWIDGEISLQLASPETTPEICSPQDQTGDDSAPSGLISWVTRDATYRISKLAAANLGIVSVAPDKTLAEAVTLMMGNDFSQLAVMTNERDVKGIISWKSVGIRLALGRTGDFVRDFMDDHHEVGASISIFDAISLIQAFDYVLVRGEHDKITGIVTGSDLSLQFQSLSEPFLLLSEIENLLRNMIGESFSEEDLVSARDPGDPERKIQNVSDLTFGEYVRLLQNPDQWAKFNVHIDRIIFCKQLDAIREIRNNVMHFDPDGITGEDLSILRSFKSFLRKLESISTT